MKKTLLAILAATSFFPTISQATTYNTGATLNFMGSVASGTCNVSANMNGTSSESINLGSPKVADIIGKAANTDTVFSIDFFACPAQVTSASLVLTGDADTTKSDAFRNSGDAKNIALVMTDNSNGNTIAPNQATSVYSVSNNAFSASVTASVVAVGTATPTPGSISSNATISLIY